MFFVDHSFSGDFSATALNKKRWADYSFDNWGAPFVLVPTFDEFGILSDLTFNSSNADAGSDTTIASEIHRLQRFLKKYSIPFTMNIAFICPGSNNEIRKYSVTPKNVDVEIDHLTFKEMMKVG